MVCLSMHGNCVFSSALRKETKKKNGTSIGDGGTPSTLKKDFNAFGKELFLLATVLAVT